MAVVDRPCRAEDVAAAHGVESVLVERSDFGDSFDRDGYTEQVVEVLESRQVDLVVMAGFGTILGARPRSTRSRTASSTPTRRCCPRSRAGTRCARRSPHGVKVTGCTVHVATVEVDAGPILAQEAVAVLPDDDEATLHERIKTVERRLYVDTIRAVVDDPNLLKGSAR